MSAIVQSVELRHLVGVEDVAVSAAVVYLFIRIVAGAIAGNVVAAWVKDCIIGQAGNTILGVIGGLGGGLILADAAAGDCVEVGSVIGQLVAGGIGGAMFTYVLGSVKNAMHNE